MEPMIAESQRAQRNGRFPRIPAGILPDPGWQSQIRPSRQVRRFPGGPFPGRRGAENPFQGFRSWPLTPPGLYR